MKHNKVNLSIVVPCYNENDSLTHIINKFLRIRIKNKIMKSELILVNNGSTDQTQTTINKYIKLYDFIKCVKIKKNIGYGNGLWQGIKVCNGEYISYTHADLQTDISDCFDGYVISKNTYFISFAKGHRIGRNFSDVFFTIGMSLFCSLILGKFMYDINAQPNVFHRSVLKLIKNPPKDFSFDLYMYYIALKHGYEIVRFPVNFKKRVYGESHWNKTFNDKIKFIKRTIKFTFKLRRQLK